MKFKKGKSGKIRIVDISINDIKNILKCQIPLKIISKDIDYGVEDYINVYERSVQGKSRIVVISVGDSTPQNMTYSQALEEIVELFKVGIPEIIIDSNIYKEKEILIHLFPYIKQSIINESIYIDFNNGMFTCFSLSKDGSPNELYFWPSDKTLYIFGKEGPVFLKETRTLEELICD